MITEMNGKRHDVRFSSNRLVPVGESINLNFIWLGTLNSPDNTVYVIGFKTDKKEDFISLMNADLKALKEKEPNDSITSQIQWIEKMLTEVTDSVWVKTPEQTMLDVANKMINDALRGQGKYINTRFTAENTIYTSGVTSMREV